MASKLDVPKVDALMKPTLEALKALGGSASNQELYDWVAEHLRLSDEVRSVPHGDHGLIVLQYRLYWARSYLKRVGAIDNSERGVWTITDFGRQMTDSEIAEVKRRVHLEDIARRRAGQKADSTGEGDQPDEIEPNWTTQLLEVIAGMSSPAFERLCQRVLRESGFTRVEVTGRSGDGGIDGIGVLRVNLFSFHVLFQCKRWKGSMGPAAVRDFRGAMVGRTDKGFIMTTGTFTPDARREATRDGAPAIDLVDGEALCSLLKNLKLGVQVRLVEEVEVDRSFFGAL
jgi:restriction system protein